MKLTCTNCGHRNEVNPAAMLGAIKSEAKAEAARRNGPKGGRPRKRKPLSSTAIRYAANAYGG